jgi:effector-binding domain-containing protein
VPKFVVEKSVTIEAPLEKVRSILADFTQWPAWSPWLVMEPEAKVTFGDTSNSYAWDGERIGTGNMTLLSEEPSNDGHCLHYQLNFLKPWTSSANVNFMLSQQNDSTKVVWTMHSSLPFFMFFMKKMMVAWVGMDYQRGLNMLKEYVELGKINSHLKFEGESKFEALTYIGINRTCATQDIGQSMEADFTQLEHFMATHSGVEKGTAFSIYHKWELVKGRAQYTAAIPVKSIPDDLDDNMIVGEIPETRVYTLHHKGDYQHLGNAWSTLYAMERNKEIVCKKGIHPFEIYINSPKEVESSALITEIKFPIA